MRYIIYSAAVVAALLTVLSTRIVIPALILCFKAIEQSYAPEAEALPTPVAVTDEPAPVKPRPARRRRPSAKTLARAEAALA